MYFFKSFGQIVEALRGQRKELSLNKSLSLQKGNEFSEVLRDLENKKSYFEKSNSSSSLLRAITVKYNSCQEKYSSEIKTLEKSQREIISGIEEILNKGNVFQELYLYSDFIPEKTFHQLVVTLVKGHKEGQVSYNSLKNLKSYREETFEKGSVYVKDTRTLYSDIILINDRNEILFLVRNKNDEFEPGKYCLPGGHVEDNENFKAAAIRELFEETGIELSMSDVVPCGKYLDSKANIHYFTAKYNGNPVVLEEREQMQYEWVPFDKVGEKALIMNLKQNLEEIIEIPRCILNSNEESSSRYYFDGSYIVRDEDVEIQKSLDKLCGDFNEGKISLLELQKGCNSIELPHEVYYIRKGSDFKCFAKLVQLSTEATEETLEKAIVSGKLVKKKKLITRGGRTFLTTVWVRPDGDIAKEEVKREIPEHPMIGELTVDDEVTLTTSRGDKKGVVSSLVDTKEGICIVLRTPEGRSTEVYLKALKGVKKSEASTPSPKPVTPEETLPIRIESGSLKKKASLGGSSEVSLVQLDSLPDKIFVLKTERSRDTGKSQLEDETCADKLYKLMGYDAPTSTIVEYEGKTHKLSTYIQGRELGSLTGKDKERAREILKKGFVMDCLLGNWDVIGASQDNILVVGSGESMVVYRIDNGSALRHRAKGASKPDSAFLSSTHIPEIYTMRDGHLNPSAAEIYGDITDEEIRAQAQFILSKGLKILSNVSEPSVKEALRNRLKWLESTYGTSVASTEDSSKPKTEERKPKPGYSSVVTEEYFEKGWDSFDFVANDGCKEHLKKKILEVEKNRESGYRRCAESLGLSLEEYKAKLQGYVEAIFEKSKPFIAIKSDTVLPLIFTEGGRFKSQFETKSSGGSLSPSYRASEEENYFAFPSDITEHKEDRPVYGYMSNQRNGVISDSGKVPPTVGQYGNIYIEIKREKAMRGATCTFGDSLGKSRYFAATPFGKPHFTALQGMHDDSTSLSSKIKSIEDYIAGRTHRLSPNIAGYYTELQYHGQLRLEDVERIHITSKNFRDDVEMSTTLNNLIEFSAKTGRVCPVEFFTT